MNQDDRLISTLTRMTAQLRQDFVRMLIYDTPLPYQRCLEINDAYHFSFSEGTFFVLILSAQAKVAGEPIRSQWLTSARDYIARFLKPLCHDCETIITDRRIYCVGSTALSQAELSQKAPELLTFLQTKPEMYICQWTMGLGRCVTSFSQIRECVFTAKHALKYSVTQGAGKFYDGNQQSTTFEGGISLISPAEQLSLQQALQKVDTKNLSFQVETLFETHKSEIQNYPVYAYMLSLQAIQLGIQTLRENMPVDRKTYELEQEYERNVDLQNNLEELICHTAQGLCTMAARYQAFLSNGRSRPIWLVIAYIQEHYKDKVTLNDLARCADRNPQYISAVFSRECGISIGEYITSLRVEEAKQLLRSTNAPIGDIAQRVGYQDPKYFSRIFRKQTGLYPRAYRQADHPPVDPQVCPSLPFFSPR